jgi:hypothetical protein
MQTKNGNYFENIQQISFAYIFIWVRKIRLWQPYRDEEFKAAEMKLLRPLAG